MSDRIGLERSWSRCWREDGIAKRETFAYACEAYSRIREQAHGPAQRSALLAQYAAGPRSSDERVHHDELIDILSEAIAARNGWKRILARCSVPQRHGQRQAVVSDHHFSGSNPFGHSSINLGSLYKGLVRDTTQNFKHLRRTPHTHHPVDDALGNAEALLSMKDEFDLNIPL